MNENNKINIIFFGTILSIGLIIAALIIGGTWRKVSRNSVTITVTGSASKQIRSDLATWDGNYTVSSTTLTDAYSKLQATQSKVKSYLVSKGFSEDKMKFTSINTTTLYVGVFTSKAEAH